MRLVDAPKPSVPAPIKVCIELSKENHGGTNGPESGHHPALLDGRMIANSVEKLDG